MKNIETKYYKMFDDINPFAKGINTLIVDNGEDDLDLNITKKNTIDFYFCIKGKAILSYDGNTYDINEGKVNMIYYSKSNVKNIFALKGTKLFLVMIDLDTLHKVFTKDTSHLSISNYFKTKHKESSFSISIVNILNQIFKYKLSDAYKEVYIKAKSIELLITYFTQLDLYKHNQCPFLMDEEISEKVIKAREELLQDLSNHITIKELSSRVNLTIHDLKSNFKKMYNDTIYSYFKKYKIKYAYDVIEKTPNIRVKEISYMIGYSNPSHFICEFKKRYGITPKQLKKKNI